MQDNTVTTNQCHVCQHLGERECKYTSHKKYKNQKGNESFRIGNISWNSSQKKPQSSYLKSLKQNEIQFQFPSQIPVPNKSIERIKNHQYDQITKNFQRTLIEKVIENQTPQKVESNQQRQKYIEVTNYQTDNKRQLDLKQFQGYPISVGLLKQQTKRQTMITTKRPTSFLKHHADAYKKPNDLQINVLRPKTPSKQIESALKQQKSPITPINSLSPIQVRNTKYHFQYGKSEFTGLTATKQYNSKKPTENSFIVDDQKIINQGGDMLISRVNDKERSSFYANNIFKDYSTIKQNKNKDQSPLKAVLSEFNQQSESPSIIQNLQFPKTNPQSPRPQINTQRPSLAKKQQLRVTFQCLPRQQTQTQRKLKNSNVSRYDFSKHSISTAQQENPYSVYIPSIYTNHNLNHAVSTVTNERMEYLLGSSPTRHQIMLYPIYPVYEIVYQLVSVHENQPHHNFSNFNQQKTTIFK